MRHLLFTLLILLLAGCGASQATSTTDTGCPPCPCFPDGDGNLVCAPCARCVSNGEEKVVATHPPLNEPPAEPREPDAVDDTNGVGETNSEDGTVAPDPAPEAADPVTELPPAATEEATAEAKEATEAAAGDAAGAAEAAAGEATEAATGEVAEAVQGEATTVGREDGSKRRKEHNRLSREEHKRRFGCPPCPCVVDSQGRRKCAPCARCVRKERLIEPSSTGAY